MRLSRAHACVGFIALWLLSIPATAAGQAASNPILTDAQEWDFGVWGAEAIGKTAGEGFGATRITMAGFHAGRVIRRSSADSGIRRTWEYTFALQPLFLVTRAQRAYGGGFAPVGLKWDFAPRGRCRPYLEFNGGAMITQKNVPRGDTSAFNFTAALGPGVMIALTPTQAMSVALRMWHLSNAYLGDFNPSFNTIELEIGYHWLIGRKGARRQLSSAPAGTQTSTTSSAH